MKRFEITEGLSPKARDWLQQAALEIYIDDTALGDWQVKVGNHSGESTVLAICSTDVDAELVACALWSLVSDIKSGEK